MAVAVGSSLLQLGILAGRWASHNPTVQKFVKDKAVDLTRTIPLPISQPQRSIVAEAKKEAVKSIKSGNVDPVKVAESVAKLATRKNIKAGIKQVPGDKLKGLKKFAERTL